MFTGEFVFVFGSNMAGQHLGGAAKTAQEDWGAEAGVAEGHTGRSYAIPTMDKDFKPLPLEDIKHSVNKFLLYAKANPDLKFLVTAIGCGIAGYKAEQIAPMFIEAPNNCMLPASWMPQLEAMVKPVVDAKRFIEDIDEIFKILTKKIADSSDFKEKLIPTLKSIFASIDAINVSIKVKDDLEIPEGLTEDQTNLCKSIVKWLKDKELTKTGGCKAFHNPVTWDEKFGNKSELIICHDGGDLAHVCNMDYSNYDLIDEFQDFLNQLGYYAEQCTTWYSAIYKL
jgi:hypothetical protein